ncbi:MAG: hypothetical protein ACSLFF_00465 [Solirubrobacterales bacterium]
MPAILYRIVRLAWRYRRVIALGLTVFVGLWEKHRHRLPAQLQKIDPPKRFSNSSESRPADAGGRSSRLRKRRG